MTTTDVLTADAMKDAYGGFYDSSPKVSLDVSQVPKELHPLIPYAEFWGLSDDWSREALIKKAPHEVLHNLKTVVKHYEEIWEPWLAGPEADNPAPSDEYVAFSALVMAADYV